MSIIPRTQKFAHELDLLVFSTPVSHTYNPLVYAWDPARKYLEKYALSKKEILIIGMNPGPWGMVQSGVPFGHIPSVKEWMGIDGVVGKPSALHPKRPVDGFACKRGEVSGKRVWEWAKNVYGEPERFFSRFLVLNYCPLAFFTIDGVNVTPDKIAVSDRKKLYQICDTALRDFVKILDPKIVIGVGGFAAKRVEESLENSSVRFGQITHPSPANPKANRGWEPLIIGELKSLGVSL
jgi:single-strand selective monofunctional uracil DNA glycosylase